MSILDSLRNLNPFSRRPVNYFTDDEGKPRTVIQTGKKKSFGQQKGTRTKSQLTKYWDIYTNEDTVWAAINSIAFNTVMVGYDIESDSPQAKELIENWCRKVDLDTNILDNTRYALVFGDAFVEIVYNRKKEPSSLLGVDPTSMEVNYDEHGIVQSYSQSLGSRDKEGIPKLDRTDICHIKFFSNPSNPYGISLIQASMDVINKKIRTDNAIANAIIRHGTSKTVFTIGNEKDRQLPPESVLKAIRDEVEDIDEKNEFIVPWNVTVATIDEKGITGVEEYYNYFQSQLVLGLLCTEEALGLGRGSTEATSKTKALLYERMIQSFQLRLSRTIEKQLFNKVLEKNGFDPDIVSIEFRSVTSADESERAKWMGNLIRGFRSSKIKPFTINEIRKKFKMKEIDMEEANTIIYEGYGSGESEPEEEPQSDEPVTDEDEEEEEENEEEEEEKIEE